MHLLTLQSRTFPNAPAPRTERNSMSSLFMSRQCFCPMLAYSAISALTSPSASSSWCCPSKISAIEPIMEVTFSLRRVRVLSLLKTVVEELAAQLIRFESKSEAMSCTDECATCHRSEQSHTSIRVRAFSAQHFAPRVARSHLSRVRRTVLSSPATYV